jgi:hypothetical protein
MLTEEEKRDAIQEAYKKLPTDQKAIIDWMIEKLIREVKARNPAGQFSRLMAMEVLGSVGILTVGKEASSAS